MDVKLEAADLALLRDFLDAMERAGASGFLVGAGARVLSFDLRWDLRGARATMDWDFAVRTESWEQWSRLRSRLVEAPDARFIAVGRTNHRFRHVDGAVLDLVPFGGLESPPGEITWPDELHMSVRGFDDAAPACEHIEVESGLTVPVAAVPSLALLKLHAYQDRRRAGERKDIQDFHWFSRHYESAGNEVRVHAELGDLLRSETIDVQQAGAALLGVDVARLHAATTIAPVRDLLAESADHWSRIISDSLDRSRVFDDDDNQARAEASRRLRAFELGLDLMGDQGLR